MIKKNVDKPTFLLVSGIWTSLSSYISSTLHAQPYEVALLVTVGNSVISWLAIQTANKNVIINEQRQTA